MANDARMTFVERIAFEASVALEKESPIVRGWNTGNDPQILAAVEQYNEAQRTRCLTAALATLKL